MDMAEPTTPEALPLVLRASRRGMIAAVLAFVLFALVTLALLAVGNVLLALFPLVLALVAAVAAVAGWLPGRTQLRLDEQGLMVASLVKRWSIQWAEVERFEAATVQLGRDPTPVVRIVYREGYERVHTPTTRLGEALGVDERYVWPGYGNLDAAALAALLERFRARFAT